MKIKFSINGNEKQVNVEKGTLLQELLKSQSINEETGLVKVNGELAHPLTELKEGDKIEFVNIIYGG